jgi:hypothetical protein
VVLAQAQDVETGAETVLLMDPAFEDVGDDASGVRPGLLCPADQPLRCPFGVFAVTLGHVLVLRGMASLVQRAQMTTSTLPAQAR